MCGERPVRSVATMLTRTPKNTIPTLSIAVLAAFALALLAWPAASEAARKTETISAISKVVSFTYTSVDGTVTQGPPAGEPKPGDVFEIDSLDFVGNHKRHAKRATMSDYLRCTFLANGEPDCFGYTAIGGSLLRFHGMDVIGGTGRYHGATGKVLKNKEVPGGSDIVVQVRRR
jgi:hypothetical protein